MHNEKRNAKNETLAQFLAQYDAGRYPRPSLTADVAAFTVAQGVLQLLLIRRKNHPFIDQWALPGGFVDIDETALCAAGRELQEETGIEGLDLRPFYTFDDVGRDPRTRVVTVGHIALAPSLAPKAGDDAAQAALFHVRNVQRRGRDVSCTLSGPVTLPACARVREDTLGETLAPASLENDGEGLASDHAYVIMRALYALCALPRDCVKKLLPGAEQALAALDIAFLGVF